MSCVNVPLMVIVPGEPLAIESQMARSLFTEVTNATEALGAEHDVQDVTEVPILGPLSIVPVVEVISRTVAWRVAPAELVDVPVTVQAPDEVTELDHAAALAVAVPMAVQVTPEHPAPEVVGALMAVKVLEVRTE